MAAGSIETNEIQQKSNTQTLNTVDVLFLHLQNGNKMYNRQQKGSGDQKQQLQVTNNYTKNHCFNLRHLCLGLSLCRYHEMR